jgi:hypothetical protein
MLKAAMSSPCTYHTHAGYAPISNSLLPFPGERRAFSQKSFEEKTRRETRDAGAPTLDGEQFPATCMNQRGGGGGGGGTLNREP